MTIANNHLNDFGEFPVNYTVNTLKNAGIKAVGATYGPFNSHQVINNEHAVGGTVNRQLCA